MSAKRHWLVLASLLITLLPRPAAAQLLTLDTANLLQNIIQAVQTVLMVGNQVLELTGLEELALGGDLAEDFSGLAEILAEADGLGQDVANIQRQLHLLFDLDTVPRSSLELQERMGLIRRYVYKTYVDALRAQSLLQSTISALQHMTRLTEAILDYLGNNQGNQSLSQWDAKLTVELIKLKTQTAAFHKAQAFDRLAEPLMVESLQQINIEIMVDYPR
jgi:conjugal transfer/entry exclusion protein